MKLPSVHPSNPGETRQYLEMMNSLFEHPGWKLFRDAMLKEAQDAKVNELLRADPDRRAQIVGWIKAARALGDWPLINAKLCQEALDDPNFEWPSEDDLSDT